MGGVDGVAQDIGNGGSPMGFADELADLDVPDVDDDE